jgi:hypothetical protein
MEMMNFELKITGGSSKEMIPASPLNSQKREKKYLRAY